MGARLEAGRPVRRLLFCSSMRHVGLNQGGVEKWSGHKCFLKAKSKRFAKEWIIGCERRALRITLSSSPE